MSKVTKKLPEIKIVHSGSLSKRDLSEVQQELSRLTQNIEVETREDTSYNAWEWVLPAAIAIYLGKGLIDGFLTEIGADTARGLKKALTKLFKKGKEANVRWVSIHELSSFISEAKELSESDYFEVLKTKGNPATIISITVTLAETKFLGRDASDCTAKFVFPAQLDSNGFLSALESLPLVLEAARARVLARVRMDERLTTLMKVDEAEASRLLFSAEYNEPSRELIFAYTNESSEWIDVNAKRHDEAKKQIESRKKKTTAKKKAHKKKKQ